MVFNTIWHGLIYLFDISKRDIARSGAEYVSPRYIIYAPAHYKPRQVAPCLRLAARLDIEQGPPETTCKAPVFGLQCNVYYVASLEPESPFILSRKRHGGGQADPPRVPSKKFYNFTVSHLLFSEKYAKIEKRRHRL